jgi:hypothetical protein
MARPADKNLTQRKSEAKPRRKDCHAKARSREVTENIRCSAKQRVGVGANFGIKISAPILSFPRCRRGRDASLDDGAKIKAVRSFQTRHASRLTCHDSDAAAFLPITHHSRMSREGAKSRSVTQNAAAIVIPAEAGIHLVFLHQDRSRSDNGMTVFLKAYSHAVRSDRVTRYVSRQRRSRLLAHHSSLKNVTRRRGVAK